MKRINLLIVMLTSLNTSFAHEGISVSIDAYDFLCKVNDDCATVHLMCTGSCGASVNKKSVEKFQKINKYLCTDYKGPWKSVGCPKLENKCNNGICMRISPEREMRLKLFMNDKSNAEN